MLLLALTLACAPGSDEPAVLLVVLDGLRWDAVDAMPALAALGEEGVRATSLVPPFPSKSYPSQVTLATGLHPDRHGIVSNGFYDPTLQDHFTYGDPRDLSDARWFQGEPIWVTAERQGLPTAIMALPGAEAPIGGVLPQVHPGIDHGWTHEERVDMALGWLEGRDLEAPARLATLYLSDADDQGHWHGPDSEQAAAARQRLDDTLADVWDRLQSRRLEHVDLLVVSDHGMAAQQRDQVVLLDRYLGLADFTLTSANPLTHLWPGNPPYDDPSDTTVQIVVEHLDQAEGMACHARQDVPPELHHSDNIRVGPIVCIAEPGWAIGTTESWEADETAYTGGMHGYDPAWSDMHGVLVGAGPGLGRGVRVEEVQAVDVYGLVAHLLGVEPVQTEGDPARWSALVVEQR